jgi:serine/threonine-protein kinase RIO1
VVQSAIGKSVILTDGTTHRRSKVLMALHNTVIAPNTEKNVIKVATKKHEDKLYFKIEGINESNVIQGKRNI